LQVFGVFSEHGSIILTISVFVNPYTPFCSEVHIYIHYNHCIITGSC
jgi:hypothetical protein